MKLALVFTVVLVLLGAMMSSVSAARAGCICPAVFDPVCGKNGQTYGNSCQLSCAGGKLAHKGACSRS